MGTKVRLEESAWPGKIARRNTRREPAEIDGKEVIPDMTLFQAISSLFHREEGQGLAEYALILALIAIVAIVALLFLGTQISTILSTIGNAV